jgi:hypothetical protein
MIFDDTISRRGFLQSAVAGVAFHEVLLQHVAGQSPSPDEKFSLIRGGNCSVRFDSQANIRAIGLQGKVYEPPLRYSFFELDGEIAEVQLLQGGDNLSFQIVTAKVQGSVHISANHEIRFEFQPAAKDAAKEIGLVLTFPRTAVFHLAEYLNVGRRIDGDMPAGQSYTAQLQHNFFVAECEGMWIVLREDAKSLARSKVEISSYPEMFTVTFSWPADVAAAMSVHSSMEQVQEAANHWLEAAGVRKLADREPAFHWIRDIKLVITVDMMRSNWEIVHDYADVVNLAKGVKELRNPKEVLFYLPGWQGAYDSGGPYYKPHAELGGETGFRTMMTYLHEQGFRTMIHTTGWGIDPYLPNIDEVEDMSLRSSPMLPAKADTEGPDRKQRTFFGFQIDGTWAPAGRPLKFKTPAIPLNKFAGTREFSFQTDIIPAACEALLTLGGVRSKDARIRLTVGRRTITSPPRWFADHEEFAFPFPVAFEPGKNSIKVTVIGESEIDWRRCWYKVRYSFVPSDPYTSWTYPILFADLTNSKYAKLFVDNVSAVVREYGIDAVHIDATDFEMAETMFRNLKEKLPDTALTCEGSWTVKAMGFWTFWQNARQSLAPAYTNNMSINASPGPEVITCACEQSALQPSEETQRELYTWLTKASSICDFVRNFIVIYPHLCATNAFVPVGKVCNIFPARSAPLTKEALWSVLNDARRLTYTPGLRVNYREYGLDKDTAHAIRTV